MKLLTVCLFVFSFVGSLAAQDARIMIMDKPDSDHLSNAYKAYQQAKRDWEAVKVEVAEKYTLDASKPETKKDGKVVKNYKEGWDKVQFSADFRAVVPDMSPYSAHPGCYSSGLYWTPNGWAYPSYFTSSSNMTNTSNAVNTSGSTITSAGGTGIVDSNPTLTNHTLTSPADFGEAPNAVSINDDLKVSEGSK